MNENFNSNEQHMGYGGTRISVSDALGLLMNESHVAADPDMRKALRMGAKALIFERNFAYLIHSIPDDWGVRHEGRVKREIRTDIPEDEPSDLAESAGNDSDGHRSAAEFLKNYAKNYDDGE